MEEVKRIDRIERYKGSILTMCEDRIQMPDGKVVSWDFLKHKGAAAVVAVRDDGKLLMVRQFRNAIDRVSLEIPAGAKNYVEEPGIDAAFRELEEETGYTTKKEWMKPLLKLVTAIAFCNEKIDIYLATGLKNPGRQHLDEDEYLDVCACDLDELVDMIGRGQIQDSKTVAAIMAYKNMVSSGKH